MVSAVDQPDFSVIIPVGERHADIANLYAEYRAALRALGLRFECIFVVDGPQRDIADALRRIHGEGEEVTVVSLTRAFGEATALMAGFQHARGRFIATLPAYYQIEAGEVGKLLHALDSADLVIAHRSPRAGGPFESLRRRTFHRLIAAVTGTRFNDLGCTARVMKREVMEEIALYGDQHRFLPLLAVRQGFRVTEVAVRQSAHDRFEGVYRPREYAHRALDIFTVFFLVRFTKKPLRFFGMLGVTTFGIGGLLLAWLVFDRLVLRHALADRPALILSSLLVVIGLQLFALGLLGELIIFTHAREIKDYQIEKVVHHAEAETKARISQA